MSQALYSFLSEQSLGEKPANPFHELSTRELEIAVHLIRGASLSDICTTLSLQPSTVGTHKARIFEKLKCGNVIDLHDLAKVYHVIPAV
jgi:two-component system invasion response regulator UvrY